MSHRNKLLSHAKPIANRDSIIQGEQYRITVLTDGLIRYEWAPDGIFEDRASTFAINRNLPKPNYRCKRKSEGIEITTDRFHLSYDGKSFTPSGLTLIVKGGVSDHKSRWRYGENYETLGGTSRTLDGVDGRMPLEPGILSRRGFAEVDDSGSMVFTDEGWVDARSSKDRVDGYVFAYGLDFKQAMEAFYAVSGPQPLLPRWSLGNWWSRYYAYTDKEYLELMDRFGAEGIPMSVGVLDIDWHLIDDPRVKEAGVSGWTGYTWRDDLFPNPKKFCDEMHKRGLKVTLNDHPADGIQSFEDVYDEVSRFMEHDTSHKDPVPFDITDPKYLEAYFDIVLKKQEDQGVDFWWVDWQQGPFSGIPGIDPLWMLNHFHFANINRDNKRPITFSRFAGPGSHRYPIGFSGDAVVTWDSLRFQPEYTATASNIGYGNWSHDIGGHMFGYKDDELATRWYQFGVFSPIMRLHSTLNAWNTKEPWHFGIEARDVMTDFLRLRHRLIPYLYSMTFRASTSPLCQPMYWEYPKTEDAYSVPNQYFFGSELIVAPITEPRDSKTRMAKVKAWLPPGKFVDIFTGAVYGGNRHAWLHRFLGGMPVLAKQGGIIPLDGANLPKFGGGNPEAIELLIFPGADNTHEMIEDDDTGLLVSEIKDHATKTVINYTQATGTLSIKQGHSKTSPDSRHWSVRVLGTNLRAEDVRVSGENQSAPRVSIASNGTLIQLGSVPATQDIELCIGKDPQPAPVDLEKYLKPIVDTAQVDYAVKEDTWAAVMADADALGKVARVYGLDMNEEFRGAVMEYLLLHGETSTV